MDDLFRQAMLFDFYSEVLTTRQQEILRMHLLEDWSLSEIAEETGISRQAVSDAIKHGLQAMEKAETRLHTVDRFLNIRSQIEKMEELLDGGRPEEELREQLQILKKTALLEDTGDSNGI